MACKNSCKLCNHLIVSTNIAYASGVLTITLPGGVYTNGEKYCLVLAQPIPTGTIIGAAVVIRVGTSTTNYPLIDACCRNVHPCSLRTRTRYATRLVTSDTGASFRLLDKACQPDTALPYIQGNAS